MGGLIGQFYPPDAISTPPRASINFHLWNDILDTLINCSEPSYNNKSMYIEGLVLQTL